MDFVTGRDRVTSMIRNEFQLLRRETRLTAYTNYVTTRTSFLGCFTHYAYLSDPRKDAVCTGVANGHYVYGTTLF